MKPQAVVMLAVAVCCGLLSMLGVRQVLKKSEEDREPVVNVVAAINDIAAGIPLDESNVRLVEVPETLVPEGAILALEDIKERGLKAPVNAGEWILVSKVGGKGQFGAIAKIPAGMAAATIPVDATTTHSGMLQAGNKIDLLMTYHEATGKGTEQKTITVLEFVEVFAIDDQTYGTEANGTGIAKNISLLVTPEQARAVTLAGNIGKLSTIMRKPEETSEDSGKESPGTTISTDFRELQNKSESTTAISGAGDLKTGSTGAIDAESLGDGVSDLLEEELKRGPVAGPQNSEPVAEALEEEPMWTMEIYEGDTVRREKIRMKNPQTP